MAPLPTPPARGLTVIELMIVVALLGVLVALVAPSMRGMMTAQRVRGINAALVTDLQYARSEAARRNQDVGVAFQATGSMSCYVAFVDVAPTTPACDCTLTPGNVCSGGRQEIKTVQVPLSDGVAFSVTSAGGPVVNFSRSSGALLPATPGGAMPDAFEVGVTGTPRGQLRTTVNVAGRPTVCSPDASIAGVPPC